MSTLVDTSRALLLSTTLLSASLAGTAANAAEWGDALQASIQKLDKETPGTFGLYIKRLDNGETFKYQADRHWYLGSTVKVPIALAVLQEMEAGKIGMNNKIVLEETDKIDGSGGTVWQESGDSFSVETLLENMLMKSDNTAANLLIRAIGHETVDKRAKGYLAGGSLKGITDFCAVRYDVYSELHPSARKLSNLDLVKLAAAPLGPQRVTAFRKMASLEQSELKVATIDEAYDRYYARDLNATTLTAYGGMLENMVKGKFVSDEHRTFMFKNLKYDSYDAYRLEAGLPRTVRFIHKTGTQYRRACHMGVIDPQDGARNAIVVVSCAENMDEHGEAAPLFEKIGKAITQTMLKDRPATVAQAGTK
ncbi:hypothetical protein BH09PSE5_BH09PSE5_19650 [soil metagenome]